MKNIYSDDLIKSYINIFLKIKENYNRLKTLEIENNKNSKEYNLYKALLKDQIFYENNIINEIYNKVISPDLVDFEDIKINNYLFFNILDNLASKSIDFGDSLIIKSRIEKEIIRIFNSNKAVYGNIEKKKKYNTYLNEIYTDEEKENMSNNDLYEIFKILSFLRDISSYHTLLFFQKEIDKQEDETFKKSLIDLKYDFIIVDKYCEKELLLNDNKRFDFEFSMKGSDKEKFEKLKMKFAIEELQNSINKIFQSKNNEDYYLEFMTYNQCSARADLLMLDDKLINDEYEKIKRTMKDIDFYYINECSKEISAVMDIFKRYKTDKGFARNLRIV